MTTIIEELIAQRSPALSAFCKNPVRIDQQVRKAIAAAWGNQCSFCANGSVEQVDHIVPKSKGGADAPENYAPSCTDCNRKKSDVLLHAPAMSLLLTQAQAKARKIRAALETNRAKTKKRLLSRLACLLGDYAQYFPGSHANAQSLAARLLDYACREMGVLDLRRAIKQVEKKLSTTKRKADDGTLNLDNIGCMTSNLLLLIRDIQFVRVDSNEPSSDMVWVSIDLDEYDRTLLLDLIKNSGVVKPDGQYEVSLQSYLGHRRDPQEISYEELRIEHIVESSTWWQKVECRSGVTTTLSLLREEDNLKIDHYTLCALKAGGEVGVGCFSYDQRWLGSKIPDVKSVWVGHHVRVVAVCAFYDHRSSWGCDFERIYDIIWSRCIGCGYAMEATVRYYLWVLTCMFLKEQKFHENMLSDLQAEFADAACNILSESCAFLESNEIRDKFSIEEMRVMLARYKSLRLPPIEASYDNVNRLLRGMTEAEEGINACYIVSKTMIGPIEPCISKLWLED